MSDSPLLVLIVFAGAAYLAKLWLDDLRAGRGGDPNPKALPGATTAPLAAVLAGVIGAVVLVGIETAGELAMGVSEEQTDITAVFLLAMIGAGIIEEVIFRGYFVVTGKGRTALYLSILGFSLLFALLHYQYYVEIPEGGISEGLTLVLDSKTGWSLLLLFLNSLWFYTVRFFKWNPRHSLLPCFAAHIASNVAVFGVKLAQGHVTGLY